MESETHWEIIEELGQGASSIVYKIRSKQTGKFYAAKTSKERKNIKTLQREALIHAQLSHPYIVQFITSFFADFDTKRTKLTVKNDGKHFVNVLELCEKSFKGLISIHHTQKNGENILKSHYLKIVEALIYLQEKEIVHRDIKPDNLMICGNGEKIGDFGLATSITVQLEKKFKGTPSYSAPEVWTNYDYSSKSDVWSLGISMYRNYFGKVPFSIENVAKDQSRKALANIIVDKSFSYPNPISQEFKNLLDAMLIKNPTRRIDIKDILRHEFFSMTMVKSARLIDRLDLMRRQKADFGEGTLDQFYLYLADLNPNDPPLSRKEFIEIYNMI